MHQQLAETLQYSLPLLSWFEYDSNFAERRDQRPEATLGHGQAHIERHEQELVQRAFKEVAKAGERRESCKTRYLATLLYASGDPSAWLLLPGV